MDYQVRVKVSGPMPSETRALHFLRESIRTVLSNRGFKRKSQQSITFDTVMTLNKFAIEVSVPDRYADQASTEMATAFYDDLVATIGRNGCSPCELKQPFSRH